VRHHLFNQKEFKDHNYTEDLFHITVQGIMDEIRLTFDTASKNVPELFADVFPFTLSHSCYRGFKKTYSFLAAKVTEPDYCLEKFDQLIIWTLATIFPVSFNEAEVERQLHAFLNLAEPKTMARRILQHMIGRVSIGISSRRMRRIVPMVGWQSFKDCQRICPNCAEGSITMKSPSGS
jgi:hypothetical protein